MEFDDIIKIRVSVDHITATSDDRTRIHFNPNTIKGYKHLGKIPIKGTKEEKEGYRVYHEYKNKETNNKVHVLTDRGDAYYLPNLTIKFFSSWVNNLKYEEVIRAINDISKIYNMPFNLSQYHVAIDLFSKDNHLDHLVKWIKSNRHYDPDENPKQPGTYHFHKGGQGFNLVAYNKKQELHEKKKLTTESKQKLNNCNVTRIESRFYNASEIPSLMDLAIHNFIDLIPSRIKFLIPDDTKLRKHGIKHYMDTGIKGLRKQLKRKKVRYNLFYYMKENTHLTNIIKEALNKYRWCDSPKDYPIVQPKIFIRPQGIKFIKH
jgi:hypothetical protein